MSSPHKVFRLTSKVLPDSLSHAPLFLDGGMGTLLQARGLVAGETPEDWNVERPDDIAAIHRAYVEAGAEIVYANTFGANRLKYHGKHQLEEVICRGLEIARRAGEDFRLETEDPSGERTSDFRRKTLVALDLGPTGKLLKPAGDLAFDDAVACFAETIRIATTPATEQSNKPNNRTILPDLIVIETMGDLLELKAAVIAAKENCDLPILATVAVDENGKLLTGGSVECVAALLESLGVDAYGFNCGLGPDKMLSAVERLAKVSTKPIVVKPNAGLPKVVGGRTVFSFGPDEFAAHVAKLVEAGASVVGGCCGTTPEHVSCLKSHVLSRLPSEVSSPQPWEDLRRKTKDLTLSSGTSVVTLSPHQGLVIGERINPTGKRALKEAYAKGDTAYVLREAVKQVDAGAAILDVNCGVPGLDETALLDATVQAVQGVATCPVQIDTADPAALERALRHVNGKPLVNSVNGKRESMDAVFPLVRKYGGAIVALCLDESGIPPTSDGRLAIARRILDEGAKYGFASGDFVFDALTLAVSSDPRAAAVTLETVRRLTDELGVNTVLGVSNVSFGLPNRPALNNAMYALAKRAGLSAAIANPAAIRDEIDPAAEDVLLGRDANCAKWIELQSNATSSLPSQVSGPVPGDDARRDLSAAISRGLRDDARAAAAALLAAGERPLELVDHAIVPALEEVGRGFEKGTVFLPQLLMAADAAGEAFAAVKGAMSSVSGLRSSDVSRLKSQVSGHGPGEDFRPETLDARRPIVIATVKGDIHDIGKNIVRALLENYGFEVIDLGRDVAPETVVETARKTGAALVGLSALMTTTVGAMAETVRALKQAGLRCRTVVGGAVVTQEYADSIGADFYAKDAMRTVRIAESLCKL